MSSSVHANNKNKDILILGKGWRQGLDNTTLNNTEYYTEYYRIFKEKNFV